MHATLGTMPIPRPLSSWQVSCRTRIAAAAQSFPNHPTTCFTPPPPHTILPHVPLLAHAAAPPLLVCMERGPAVHGRCHGYHAVSGAIPAIPTW